MHQKMKSLEFFKITIPHFEGNLLSQKGGVDFHKSYSWTKIFFVGQHILNHNEISFSAI